jgi:plasmid maintenance system antidote protein VapI
MPRSAIHPGEILADELNELGVTPTELSRQSKYPPAKPGALGLGPSKGPNFHNL